MNTYQRSLGSVLFTLYIGGVLLLAASPLRTMIQPGFQGILYKGGDESQYIMRVNQAMHHPFSDVSNSIVSGPEAPKGLQMTLPESVAGTLFSWSGISAPSLTILLSILIAPLLMPLFAHLALRFGIRRRDAVIGSAVLFFLLIGPLRRVVHQSWSLPLAIFILILLTDWWKNPSRIRSVILGVLLGILPGIYFWAWTYVWGVFGCIILLTVIAEARHRTWKALGRFVIQAVTTGVIALATASPFLFMIWMNSHDPASADAGFRSSLIHAREFESLPRSIVLVLLAILSAFAISRQSDRRRLLPLLAMLLALVAVTHQQFVHGQVLSFWTHYYPYVCMISMLLVLVFLGSRVRATFEVSAAIVGSVFLLAAFSDYYGRASIFLPINHWQKYQHLAPSVLALNRIIEKQTVISDWNSSLIVGTYTDHDLIFTPFMRHTLVPFTELAERYCLIQFATGKKADTEWLPLDVKELSAAGKAQVENVLQRDFGLSKKACDHVYADPKSAFSRYSATLVLWDEKNNPDWKIPDKYFTVSEKGSGWSIWHVR